MIGNQNVIVGALAKGLSLLFADSDDLVGPAIDSDLFPQGIAAGEQVVNDVGSHDGDLNVVVQSRSHSIMRPEVRSVSRIVAIEGVMP